MVHNRSLRAMLVDVAPARRSEIVGALTRAGWSVDADPVAGTDALSAALTRRGWDVVIYGGEGEDPVPARKAKALVRMADAELPFVAAVPSVRPGDLSAFVQGLEPDAILAPDATRVSEVLERVISDARPDAHRLLLAQQAITDHVAAGLAPDELCARALATLGETLGWTFGAVWRPEGGPSMLRCTAVWHDHSAGPEVEAFAEVSRRVTIAPGRGVPGRAYAFRRPAWVADVAADGNMARQSHALRAGLTTAAAFPIALADDCAGVLEFFGPAIQEPDAQVVAMFATVGGQLAQYLERRRLQADESRRVEAALRAERDRAQRYLDVAGTMILVLDADGRVLLINRKGCAVLDRPEGEVVGADWFELAIPDHERAAVRAGFNRLMAGDEPSFQSYENSVVTSSGQLRSIAWHNTVLRDPDGAITGTLSSGEDVTERLAAEQQITYLAYHDALTGLPNRTLLEQHLALALARARSTGAEVALLQLDLDNFKLVNDSLGHGAGDQLIRELTARLQRAIAPTDLLARTGGDGFHVLLADLRRRSARGGRAARRRRSASGWRSRSWSPAPSSRCRRRSGSRRPPATGATPRRCSPAPTRRCTGPRTRRAAAGRSTRRPAATRSSGSRWPPGCGARSSRRSSSCTTSRSSSAAAGSSPSRRCCAGTTPTAARWCRRASSSPSPRRPA